MSSEPPSRAANSALLKRLSSGILGILPRGGAWSLTLRLGNLTTTLITVAFFTRALGPSSFGSWSVLTAVVVGMGFLDLGLGHALIRRTGRSVVTSDRSEALAFLSEAQHVVTRRVAIPVVLFSFTLAAVSAIANLHVLGLSGPDLWSSIAVGGLIAASIAVLGLAPKVRIGIDEVAPSARYQLVGCAAQIPVVALVATTDAPLGVYLLASLTSQLIGFGLDSLRLSGGDRSRVRHALDDETKHEGRAYMMLSLLGFAGFGLDPLITGAILSPTDAGLVALAARIIITPQGLVLSLFQPSWGRFARIEHESPRDLRGLVRRSTLLAGGATVAVCVVAGLLARPILSVLAGPTYQFTTPLIWATVAAGSAMGIASAIAFAMNGLGLVWSQFRISSVAITVNVILSIALCSTIGLAGAPLGTAIAHTTLALVPGALLVHRRLEAVAESCGESA